MASMSHAHHTAREVLPRMLQGSAGPAMVALVQQGLGWVPTACNLAAALAFGLCLSLNAHLTGGSDLSILALAPLLLLLTQVPHALACKCSTPGAAAAVDALPPTGRDCLVGTGCRG